MRSPASDQYASVQLLRFVAAMLVVVMHTTEAMTLRMPVFRDIGLWVQGASGVDIFFVISGFVMTVSSRPASHDRSINLANAIDFFKRRLLRVVPLYWVYTILKIILVLILPVLALRTTLDPAHITASFLFLPWESPWGLIQPVLPVGWTLNFEMLFYLIFATAIALNCNRLLFCGGVFLALYVAAQWFPDTTALAFYGHTLLFEFVIGMLVAQLRNYRLALPWAVLLLITGTALLGSNLIGVNRVFLQGLGAGLLVLGGINLERNASVKAALSKVAVLGDISYSSYLCHSMLVPLGIVLLALTPLEHAGLVILLTLLFVTGGSFCSYFWLERPMTQRLKQIFFAPRASTSRVMQQPVSTRMENL